MFARSPRLLLPTILILVCISAVGRAQDRRVPAEWEPQSSVWMQWPKNWEGTYRPEFNDIIDVLQEYEPIDIIVHSSYARTQAQNYLLGRGTPLDNISWHILPYENAWLRDNGPVWFFMDGELSAQDWGFDGWGGLVNDFDDDDAIPCQIAGILDTPCESQDLILERGNLEFNGAGTLISSWTCQNLRNPAVSQAAMESLFQDAFGVTQIIWLEGAPTGDVTGGHVDGIARFIDENTVAVNHYVDQGHPDAGLYEDAALRIAAAGFEVLRVDMPGSVFYNGSNMDIGYLNWLVVDGLVIVPGFDAPTWDEAARVTIAGFFPNHDVVVVDCRELWYWGGGVHCVTNDLPRATQTAVDDAPVAQSRLLTLAANQPNPFNPSTTIHFALAEAGVVSVEIFDLTGRRVDRLLDAELTAGEHSLNWQATGLSSGLYLCRVKSRSVAVTGRMLLLK